MKFNKLLCLLLALALCLSIVACSGKKDDTNPTGDSQPSAPSDPATVPTTQPVATEPTAPTTIVTDPTSVQTEPTVATEPTVPTESTEPTVTEPVGTLSLNKTEVVLSQKDEKMVLYNGTVPVDQVTFTSDNPAVVTFVNGEITAVGGSAEYVLVHAEYNGQKVSCKVRCDFDYISMNRIDMTLSFKDDAWILYNGDVDKKLVTFTSENPSVAIFIDGIVTAVSPGTTTVYAEYNGQKISCIVRCSFEQTGGTPGTGGIIPDGDNTVLTGTVKVNDYLNIRSGPGGAYGVVGYYYPNDKVTITQRNVDANGNLWGKTDKGWVSMAYIQVDNF